MADQNVGPGAAFENFELSEILADKLKLLDYEKELVGKVDGMKIVPRYSFLSPTNQSFSCKIKKRTLVVCAQQSFYCKEREL